MTFIFIVIAAISIYYMNKLMDEFCKQREVSENQERKIFRVANGTTVIWLFSTYIEVMFF